MSHGPNRSNANPSHSGQTESQQPGHNRDRQRPTSSLSRVMGSPSYFLGIGIMMVLISGVLVADMFIHTPTPSSVAFTAFGLLLTALVLKAGIRGLRQERVAARADEA